MSRERVNGGTPSHTIYNSDLGIMFYETRLSTSLGNPMPPEGVILHDFACWNIIMQQANRWSNDAVGKTERNSNNYCAAHTNANAKQFQFTAYEANQFWNWSISSKDMDKRLVAHYFIDHGVVWLRICALLEKKKKKENASYRLGQCYKLCWFTSYNSLVLHS